MRLTGLLLVSLVLCPGALSFQGTKVGMVDADRVIQNTIKGKEFLEQMDVFSASNRNELKILEEEYITAKKDYEAKAAILNEGAAKEYSEKLAQMKSKLARQAEDLQRQIQIKMEEGLDVFRKNLAKVISQVAIEKGLDLVLNMGPQSDVVYFHDRIDITNDVIKKYDETVQ